ncbi:hypothetical protein A9Q81_24630 [Gammaproteobacteria bacterium 42_54_T18]|nr:hypothetical protein A9Q81_24630 [Gammaproteobacteria bacterium 42_54_T18]
MKLTFLYAAITAGLLTTGCSSTSVADSSVAGGPVAVSNWHNTNDDFAGLKKVTFADDLYLAVSKSGVYNKENVYVMPAGYHWATFEELEERLKEWKGKNGSRALGKYNYHGLGGWDKYAFDGVQRRDFIYANTAKNDRVVYAGISENKITVHKSSWDANYTNNNKVTVKNWAGFVLIKD